MPSKTSRKNANDVCRRYCIAVTWLIGFGLFVLGVAVGYAVAIFIAGPAPEEPEPATDVELDPVPEKKPVLTVRRRSKRK